MENGSIENEGQDKKLYLIIELTWFILYTVIPVAHAGEPISNSQLKRTWAWSVLG